MKKKTIIKILMKNYQYYVIKEKDQEKKIQ